MLSETRYRARTECTRDTSPTTKLPEPSQETHEASASCKVEEADIEPLTPLSYALKWIVTNGLMGHTVTFSLGGARIEVTPDMLTDQTLAVIDAICHATSYDMQEAALARAVE